MLFKKLVFKYCNDFATLTYHSINFWKYFIIFGKVSSFKIVNRNLNLATALNLTFAQEKPIKFTYLI